MRSRRDLPGRGRIREELEPDRAFCVLFGKFHIHHRENLEFDLRARALPSTVIYVLNVVYVTSVVFIQYLVLDYLKETGIFFIVLDPHIKTEQFSNQRKPTFSCMYFLLLCKALQEHTAGRQTLRLS